MLDSGETRGPKHSGQSIPMAEEHSVVSLVERVLRQGIDEKASDIHFETFASEVRIRYRVGGHLYQVASAPKSLAAPLMARIKVLADLDVNERKIPQDGSIRLQHEGRRTDLRVSTLPIEHGESVVLRILDKNSLTLDLESLGMPEAVVRSLRRVSRLPNGILLATGPTGSGKTTTLYSILNEFNTTAEKLLTVEDPVEYTIDGVQQVQVHPAIGLTFATALRAFLRQDPDIILVGEIRDEETARIAIQASLTGHLVFSTLHTNDAAATITRLLDMGLEPYLLAATLEGILAQRLLRKLCGCAVLETIPPTILREWGEVSGEPFAAARPVGCKACRQRGYQGRLGLFEWMEIDEELRECIARPASASEIRAAAVRKGMIPLRRQAWELLRNRGTSLEEVQKYL